MNQKDVIYLITYVVPTLSVKQATNVLDCTFKNKHAVIDIGRSGPGVNIYQRKLDALLYVKSDSGLVNNPESLKRQRYQLQLATSIEDFFDSRAELDKDKTQKLHKYMQYVVVAEEKKLNDKNGDTSKLTKIEIA